MDESNVQLTLLDVNESEPPFKMDEIDSFQMWKLAVYQFDNKRWSKGWRPWHKGE